MSDEQSFTDLIARRGLPEGTEQPMERREALAEVRRRWPRVAGEITAEEVYDKKRKVSICRFVRGLESLGGGTSWEAALEATAKQIREFHPNWEGA